MPDIVIFLPQAANLVHSGRLDAFLSRVLRKLVGSPRSEDFEGTNQGLLEASVEAAGNNPPYSYLPSGTP